MDLKQIFTIPNIISIAVFLAYLVVFLIQKAQLNKQKEIFQMTSEILKIINIDDIKKYVELQKENNELQLSNEKIKITELINQTKKKESEIDRILKNSKLNLQEISVIKDQMQLIIESNVSQTEYYRQFLSKISDIYSQEIKEIYEILREEIEGKINNNDVIKIHKHLNSVYDKYEKIKKNELVMV